MSVHNSTYVQYTDSVESKHPNEDQTFEETTALMLRLATMMNDHYRHAVRAVHAKSHGLLKAELTVNDQLPEPLRQGLFSTSKVYPAIIRFSTTPGDILADSISTPRGMAVKVVGAQGEMLPGHEGQVTQDFVFVNAKSFSVPDTAAFLKGQKLIEANANDPELFKKLVSNVARGTNAVLGLLGVESTTLAQLGHPETHILGETYGSTVAIRYGNYIAKMVFRPVSENLKALTGKHVPVNFHFSGLRDAVVEFFKTEKAEWEVGVQLCTDLKKMPVEDPSVPWSEDESPYQAVGKLVVEPQEAYSPERRVYVDEVLSFNPWNALAAHRPLGNIMRARRHTYPVISEFRHRMNGRPNVEPKSIEELPA